MIKIKTFMCSMLLPAMLIGCQDNSKESAKIIEKPSVKIENGMLTPEVLEAFGRITSAVPSPDGTKIAFTLSYESIEENKSNAEIYIVDSDGQNIERLTHTAGSESNIQWIEEGARIAYLAIDKETSKPQIHTMKPDGSDVRRISSVENGIECFVVSPDGKRVVFGTPIKAFNKNEDVFKDLPLTTGRMVDDLMYKHWDEWVTEIPHPFIADFDANGISNEKDIMEGEPFECPMRPFGGAETFAWSPDSKYLIYTSRKLKGMEYAFSTDSNLYLYDITSGKTEILTEGMPGYDTNPVFSPDGKTLAWMSMEEAKYESDKNRIMLMDMSTRAKRDLSENWDRSAEGLAWTPDGKYLIVNAYDNGTQPIFRINATTAEIDTIAGGQYDYVNVSPLCNSDRVVALRHSMQRPNEIVIADAGNVAAITDINGELISQIKLGNVEKKMIPTTSGELMTTWVIYPPNFDPTKKYPAILYCQGGPQQAVSQFWSYRWNFMIMAAHGYIIIAPNRHGVPGFGKAWNKQISGDYGGQNMQDYLSAVDYMKQESYIDAEHIGAIGASYGGFSVYWLAGHHEGRFAALIAHAGIFNIEAQYLETEEMWFADYDIGGPYWEKENAIAQRTYANSPHRFVNNWTAPMLITVGELDYRILASQGMQAFNAAKMHGLEAEMLVFPDENHWILKPQNAILWQRVFFRFLDKYLKTSEQQK